MCGPQKNQIKRKEKMNPLTHFTKIRILPLLIAPALVALAAFTAVPARATLGCGTTSTNLLSPVSAGYFPDGLLDLMCRDLLRGWDLKTKVKGDSDLYVTLVTFQPAGQTGQKVQSLLE
jgi:hypothetical protein